MNEQPKPVVSMVDVRTGNMGICLKCHEISDDIESDARKVDCEWCESSKCVYGLLEAVQRQLVTVVA